MTNSNYQQLLQECKEIITEFGFTHRWALIELYWTLGKRINEEENVTVTQLAEDLGKSERTIQRAVQFHRMYPDLTIVPLGKNASWHMVCNKLLPEPKDEVECVHELIVICKKCRKTQEKYEASLTRT